MHRRPLLEILAQYVRRYPDEASVVDRIRALVESSPNCFERTCAPGHITGSAWVLSQDRQRCLLLHHGKLGRWLQPGGHADGQSDIAAVALREAQEETGLSALQFVSEDGPLISLPVMPLDVDVHDIPARHGASGNLLERAHEHHDIRFLLIAAANEPLVLSDESHDLGWFTRDEALARTSEESVLRMLLKAGPGKAEPYRISVTL